VEALRDSPDAIPASRSIGQPRPIRLYGLGDPPALLRSASRHRQPRHLRHQGTPAAPGRQPHTIFSALP